MVKKFFSHYAPRPLQLPQMPDMKQVKSSVCNHIRHFSLLSYLPSAGNPSTQPPIRRLALPLIRSITQPNDHASLNQPTTQSPSFHRPRHTLQTHSSPPPPTILSFPPPSRRTQPASSLSIQFTPTHTAHSSSRQHPSTNAPSPFLRWRNDGVGKWIHRD